VRFSLATTNLRCVVVSRSAGSRGLTGVVLRGASLAASGFLLTNLLTLGFYVALARLATPRDFGVLAAGSVLVYFSATFVESGLAAALIRRRDDVDEAANTVLVATVAAGAGLAVVALAAAPLVGHFFGSQRVTHVAAAMSGILLVRSFGIVPSTLLQKRFSFVRRVVVTPAGVIGFGTAAVVTTAHGWGVWGLVLGSYVSVAVEVVLAWAFVGWRPRLRRASFRTWRSLAAFGRHVIAADVVMSIGDKADSIVVGRVLNTAALGQYRYAWRVAVIPLAAVVNIGAYVLYPAFAAIASDDERLRSAFLRALRWLSIAGLPASLLLLPLGEPLVVLVFGEQWRPAGRAVSAMCLFAAGHTYDSVASEAWKAAGRPDLLVRMHALSVGSLVALMLALVPLGLTGMGIALSASSVVVAAYALRGAGRVLRIPMRRLLDETWPPALAATATAGILYVLDRVVVQPDQHGLALGLALLLAEAAAGAVLYLVLLAAIRPARASELRELVAIALTRREAHAQPLPRG
jgi:O-antigen/teichoic acid export membrane protein